MPTEFTFPTGEVKAALNKLAQQEARLVRKTLFATGEILKKEQKRRSPFRFGFLRDSHRSQLAGDGRSLTLSANVDYALFVHEKHPTRRRWFVEVIEQLAPDTIRRAIAKFTKET